VAGTTAAALLQAKNSFKVLQMLLLKAQHRRTPRKPMLQTAAFTVNVAAACCQAVPTAPLAAAPQPLDAYAAT
jgi:hypothetical protein